MSLSALDVLKDILAELQSGTTGGALTPTIYNVTTVATVENSQALSLNTKQFLVRARGNSTIQYSFTTGTTGTNFVTIPRGASKWIDGLKLSTATTIYFQSDKADVIEIEEWV